MRKMKKRTTKKARKRFTIRFDKHAGYWRLGVTPDEWISRYHFVTKDLAIMEGRSLARRSEPAQLVIFKKNGQIQTEYTYGKDPKRHPG